MFDLDGTLLDTLEDLTNSMNHALGLLGFPPRSRQECKYFVGDGIENFARRALPEGFGDRETVEKIVLAHRAYYAVHWADKTKPYPGIGELLEELSARGVKMSVFSNKPDDVTQLNVGRFLSKWRFDLVRGALPGVPLKPDPAGALRMADELGVRPAEMLYLGDTNTDMQTAESAGFYPAGALWGFRTREELLESGAKVLLKRPMDLLKLLESY